MSNMCCETSAAPTAVAEPVLALGRAATGEGDERGEEITELMETGKLNRPDKPAGGVTVPKPVRGSAVPKAGKKFGGGTAPQGA